MEDLRTNSWREIGKDGRRRAVIQVPSGVGTLKGG